jgi:hypothetical protein
MIKITVKNFIRVIVFTPIVFFLLFSVHYFLTHEHKPKYFDCGVVVSKSNDEVVIKYGTRTNLYLNIEFEKSGFQSIRCSPTTYFQQKVGNRVCFDLDEEYNLTHEIKLIVGFLVLCISCLICTIILLVYLFSK